MERRGQSTGAAWRREVVLVAAVAAGALVTLLGAVTRSLAVPRRPAAALDWALGAEPALLAAGLLCVLGILLEAHALVVVVVALLADALRLRPLARLASALAVGPVRVLLVRASGAVVGTGLVLVPTVASATPLASTPPPTQAAPVVAAPARVEVATPLPPDPTGVATARPLTQHDGAANTAVAVRDRPGRAGARSAPVEEQQPVRPAADVDPEPGEAGSDLARWRRVTVRPGDHLWALAERDVAARAGGVPDEVVVRRHWIAVVEANRDRLVVADDPDLVLPGQYLLLPPLEEG